ncbi:putative ribonuclease H-like domain-containing protein [Tanacetum coccineum]
MITGPNSGMEAGPSGSSGPTTRSKKRKNTGTNDDSQASPSFLDAHDKGDLCPWVLYVGKDKFTQNWVVKTHKDTHTCLQSREIKHCTYKFLSEKIFEQVRVNPDIPVKAVQDQLQRELEVQISMSKAFRAKAKAEREIRGDHKRSVRLRWCIHEGAISRPMFGYDIDLHPNSNFTFISDRQKGIIPAIKTVYPSAEHRYCLRHIHENMKQGWCGQAYKDLLWRAASATNVRDFEKCMLELKTMNPKAHEWLNKIPAEHWARSHFSGRAKSDLLLNNICEVFNGKIVGGVIDKCTGPLTSTATRIMESIKKEAHLIKEIGIDRDSILQGFFFNMGGNNAKASGSASRQAQQTEPVVGQDGSGGLSVGVVIGLSAIAGEGGAGGPGDVGVGSQGSSHTR